MPHIPISYSQNEIERLEQEAVRRAREMQQRSIHRAEASSPTPSPSPQPISHQPQQSTQGDILSSPPLAKPAREVHEEKRQGPTAFLDNIAGSLGLDHDRLILLLLALLLLNEECDKTLLFALGYILL